jgi:hypothetical protein
VCVAQGAARSLLKAAGISTSSDSPVVSTVAHSFHAVTGTQPPGEGTAIVTAPLSAAALPATTAASGVLTAAGSTPTAAPTRAAGTLNTPALTALPEATVAALAATAGAATLTGSGVAAAASTAAPANNPLTSYAATGNSISNYFGGSVSVFAGGEGGTAANEKYNGVDLSQTRKCGSTSCSGHQKCAAGKCTCPVHGANAACNACLNPNHRMCAAEDKCLAADKECNKPSKTPTPTPTPTPTNSTST